MMRRTFLTSALDMPEIMSYIYSKSWKLQFSASSSIIIIEDYYLQTFLHSLKICIFFAIILFLLHILFWLADFLLPICECCHTLGLALICAYTKFFFYLYISYRYVVLDFLIATGCWKLYPPSIPS